MGVVGCLNVVSGNPYIPDMYLPASPVTDKPNIILMSPSLIAPFLDNQSIQIFFVVSLPVRWIIPAGEVRLFVGTVSSVSCEVDNSQVLFDPTTIVSALGYYVGGGGYGGYTIWQNGEEIPLNYNFNQSIEPLPIGQHTITISLQAKSFYGTGTYDASISVQYNFTVISSSALSPTISDTPTITSTPMPSPTLNLSPTPTFSPSPSLTSSPSVPEFPNWTALPLILVVISIAVATAAFVRIKKKQPKSIF